MKRMWIGAALLAVLLALSLLTAGFMERKLLPGAEDLRRAGDYALAEEWDKAKALTDAVRAKWKGLRPLASPLSTHDKVESIETAFEQFAAYAGDGAAYSALCTALAAELEGLAKAHQSSWENFF